MCAGGVKRTSSRQKSVQGRSSCHLGALRQWVLNAGINEGLEVMRTENWLSHSGVSGGPDQCRSVGWRVEKRLGTWKLQVELSLTRIFARKGEQREGVVPREESEVKRAVGVCLVFVNSGAVTCLFVC